MVSIILTVLVCNYQAFDTSLDTDCGIRCCFVAMNALKPDTCTYEELKEKFDKPEAPVGHRWSKVQEIVESYGFHVITGKLDFDFIKENIDDCIPLLYRHPSHVVMVQYIEDGKVFVLDPPNENTYEEDYFKTHTTGIYMLISIVQIDKPEHKWPEPYRDPRKYYYFGGGGAFLLFAYVIYLWSKRKK